MELSLLNLLLVLLAAWAGGSIAQRFGYPTVLGELAVGIILGPALLGVLGDDSWVNEMMGVKDGAGGLGILAQVGVLLLMLYIGMEIDPKELGKASWGGFLAAIGGFVTPFAMGWFVVVLFGGTHIAGVFVGIAVGVTSLATKSRILFDLKILDTRIAHVMMAGALIADTLSLVVFAAVIGFAEKEALELIPLLLVGAKAIAFFLIGGVVGIYVLPRLFKLVQSLGIKHRGIYFTLMLVIALAYGEAAHLAGLHAVLGTFVAGLFLREGMLEPKLNHEVNDLVRDISVGFLAPVFFVMAGFDVSFDVFQTDLWLFLSIIGVAFLGKIAGTALFYLPTGNGWREGLVLGAGMNGRGAVEIILAGIGLKMGLITQEIFSILVFMAIITTATVPMLLKWGVDWLKRVDMLVRSAGKRDTVLFIGASPTAQALAALIAETRPVWMISSDIKHVADAQEAGLNAVAGNALETLALAEAHANEASMVLAVTGNVEINVLAARQMREIFLASEVGIAVRGHDRTADAKTFEHLEARMLFARPVILSDWDYWFMQDMVAIERIPAPATTSEAVLRWIDDHRHVLPMAIETQHESKRRIIPFLADSSLNEGDMLILARAQIATEPHTDRFDDLVRDALILDIDERLDRESFFMRAAEALAADGPETLDDLSRALHDRETMSSTVLTPGLAVPHVVLEGEGRFALLVVRCLPGVDLEEGASHVHSLFVLAASPDQRNFHLKALSAIAQIWQAPSFESDWRAAKGPSELRELLLRTPRQRTT